MHTDPIDDHWLEVGLVADFHPAHADFKAHRHSNDAEGEEQG